MTAVSLTDWAACLFLGTGITAAVSIPVLLLADAEPSDFNPRRLLDTTAGAWLLVEIVNARLALRAATREAALAVAVLLMLLAPAAEATS